MATRTIPILNRRRLLATLGTAAVATGLDGIARPFISRAADRPVITHGVQSGDVSVDSGMVWARADRPSRMLVEVATTDSFKTIHSGRPSIAACSSMRCRRAISPPRR